jgi:hypothetical protein
MNWKESARRRLWPIEVLSQHLPADTEEPGTASVKIVGISVDFRTKGLSNTIREVTVTITTEFTANKFRKVLS